MMGRLLLCTAHIADRFLTRHGYIVTTKGPLARKRPHPRLPVPFADDERDQYAGPVVDADGRPVNETTFSKNFRANAKNLPSMLYDPGAVGKGGLATYSADYNEVGRLSAKYVHRVLEGADPADLSVKLSLVINLKTAKQIGLVIPESVLARADKIIE